MLPHSDEATGCSDSQAAMSPSLSPSAASAAQHGSGNLLRALVNQGVIPTPVESVAAMAQRAGRSSSSAAGAAAAAAGAAAAAAGAAAAEAAAAAAVMPPPPPRERSVSGASTLIGPAIGSVPLPTFALGTAPGIGADMASACASSAAGSAVTSASASSSGAASGEKLCKRELQEALTDAHEALTVSGVPRNVAPRVPVALEGASAGVVADPPASAVSQCPPACSQPVGNAADGSDSTPCGYASEQ